MSGSPPLSRYATAKHPWAGRAQWRILETGFRSANGFLAAWRAWQQDPERPVLLHHVAIAQWPMTAADLLQHASPDHQDLAAQLAAQWWGLTPGLHRLQFEAGRVLLTVFVGPQGDALREAGFVADAIDLAPASPASPRDLPSLKALSRVCRRGTQLTALQADAALWRDLVPCGFRAAAECGLGQATSGGTLQAVFDPAWAPKGLRSDSPVAPTECIVIGGGLAGAAAAASLARRGWQVQVLDAAQAPAGGASGLPAGLMAPHLSPDDNLLSRLSRAGVRMTLQQAQALLEDGTHWHAGGVLEHRLKGSSRPVHSEGFAADWSRPASADEKQRAWLPAQAPTVWHGPGAWIRPGALVRAWLAQPGIRWRGGVRVERLVRVAQGWQVRQADGRVAAEAPLLVIAAALGSAALADGRLWLHPVRGQVSWAPHTAGLPLPAFPVNGHGHLLPSVPMEDGLAWMTGSTYGRGETDLAERAADHLANHERLRTLVPLLAGQLAPAFAAGQVRGWTGVRCASTDRRPLVGEIEPGLWVSTAMGSRGLTFAALCAELLAARLHAEPLPLPLSLAAALDVQRQLAARRSSAD